MKLSRPPYFSRALHVMIWLLLISIPTIIFHGETSNGLTQTFFIVATFYNIGLFYFNAYFLYPRLLTRKRWPLYIICIVAIVMASYHLKIYILNLSSDFLLTPEKSRIIFFSLIPFVVASIIFRLISDRIHFERMEKEARTQRLDAELKFLRSQVSPHFLFNMLTNMVSLARKKSDILEPSLLKLSDLLRYMLYDSGEEKISIRLEMEQLENYIALQQLRFGEDVKIETNIKNDCPECMIEPMLLIPFIENAYKHGVGMVKDPYINISMVSKDNQLNFIVTNNYNPANHSKDKNSGIGLVNVKNRLKLLYPGKYDLTITDESGIFSVHLKLDLS
ncbi:MAG TPA: histidine kinase [Puia sp.]|nr:histidine kinase [Puia sp.]